MKMPLIGRKILSVSQPTRLDPYLKQAWLLHAFILRQKWYFEPLIETSLLRAFIWENEGILDPYLELSQIYLWEVCF